MGRKFYTFADGDDSFVCDPDSAVFDGFRIALVTDLHGRTFGPDNDWLVGQLTNAHPDLIALAGDIADEESNLQVLSRRCRAWRRLRRAIM